MKKSMALVLAVLAMRILKTIMIMFLALLLCASCSGSKTSDPVNMDELLKISTWLLDDELEGTGNWGYIDPSTRTYPRQEDGDGYWIPDDGVTKVANQDVFEFDRIELGVPRTMAPMSMYMTRDNGDHIGYSNLNLYIDYDGIAEVKKLEPNDSTIRLKYSLNGAPIEAEEISVTGPCVINVCPVGKEVVSEGTQMLVDRDTLTGKEYTLQIQGCTLGGNPVITAVVKLTSIPDPEYPWETIHAGRYGEFRRSYEERTRFCSIELISYTYSEMYILGGAVGNIEE